MTSPSNLGLLTRYRRPWFAIGLCLLAVPMMVQLAELPEALSEDEGRMLSAAPPCRDRWPNGAHCHAILTAFLSIISGFGRN
jgi:hypothetical protein